ncbi:MAG: TniQ family protein [Planctomycetes bacterium]|nr:TniQ family protein [Planctomycetota bacterium]
MEDTARALPAREPLLSGESLTSLVRRTAQAMGYEGIGQIRKLLGHRGELPAHLNHLFPGTTLDRLSRMLLLPAERVLGSTLHDYARQLMLVPNGSPPHRLCDSATILRHFDSAHPPVCPRCLIEDERPYERLVWSIRALPVCLQHDCYLVRRCPACSRLLRPDRPLVSQCHCSHDFSQATATPVAATALSIYHQMECWYRSAATPLAEHASCASLWWLERLASAVERTPSWLERETQTLQLDTSLPAQSAAWLVAAKILTNWPAGLFTFLAEFDQVVKFRSTATGVTRGYGLLLRDAKHLEDLGYPFPADALRTYLTANYSGGSLSAKVCLFNTPQKRKLLRHRSWITPTEADDLLRARPGTSVDLVSRGILTGRLSRAQRSGRRMGVILRESVRQFQATIGASWTVHETGRQLGLGRHTVYELIRVGCLPGALRAGGCWRVPRTAVETLLRRYQERPANKRQSPGWFTVREATRQFGPSGLTMGRLLKLVFEESLATRRLDGQEDLRGLLVSEVDLVAALPAVRRARDDAHGCSLSRLAQTLFPQRPMKEPVLKKWIVAGLLQANRAGRSWIIEPAEIDRFRQTYCLFTEAAALLHISRSTLARWEAEGRIAAVYGRRSNTPGGFSLYRRAAVEQLKLRPLRRVRQHRLRPAKAG